MAIGRYECPATAKEAVELLSAEKGEAAVLAGGSDLLGGIRAGLDLDLLVDIKRIPELSSIQWEADGTLFIGACVSVQQVADDRQIARRYPVLAKAAGSLGSYQVRCRATIAGNLGNASPCADNAPALLVLEARVRITSPQGRKEVPLNGFIKDVKKTALQRGEIITTLVIPSQPAGLRSAFFKIKRVRGHDMALVNAAGAYNPETGDVRLAIGSAACTPVLVGGLEGACPPGTTADQLAELLAERALASIAPIDDVRASAEYRRDMTVLLCRRLADSLLSENK